MHSTPPSSSTGKPRHSALLDLLDGKAPSPSIARVNQQYRTPQRGSGSRPSTIKSEYATVGSKRPLDVDGDDDDVIDLTKDDDDDDFPQAFVPSKRAKVEAVVKRDPVEDEYDGDLSTPQSHRRRSASPPAPSSNGLSPTRLRQILSMVEKDIAAAKTEIAKFLQLLELKPNSVAYRAALDEQEERLAELEQEKRDMQRQLIPQPQPARHSSSNPVPPGRPLAVKNEEFIDDHFGIPQHPVAGPSRPNHAVPRQVIKPEDRQNQWLVPRAPMNHNQLTRYTGPGPFQPAPQDVPQDQQAQAQWPVYDNANPNAPMIVPPGYGYVDQFGPAAPAWPPANPFIHAAHAAGHQLVAGAQAVLNGVQAAFGAAQNPMLRALQAAGAMPLNGRRNVPGGYESGAEEEESDDEEDPVHRSRRRHGVNEFILAAGNADRFNENATVQDALAQLNLADQRTPLPGMEVNLLPHQLIGVAWMKEQETSERVHHYGGILADEMGLGKTVATIAVMTINLPKKQNSKGTLIVAPLALLEQWKTEIETKTKRHLFSVHVYHGSNNRKAKSKEALQEFDVVLTTFHTLANEFPTEMLSKNRSKKKKEDWNSEDEKDLRRAKDKMGLLFKVRWHRVVLDEAQYIRNRTTRMSQAVSHLKATYRWVLTGTPIINSLADVYAYVRFLAIRPWYEWPHYNEKIVKQEKGNPVLCSQRLQALLKTCLLRRNKESMLDGKRLINLPKKEVVLSALQFSREEREIYQFVEKRAAAVFNKFLKAGTVLKNYHHVLVMLLRLRQVCSHPALITENQDTPVESAGDELKVIMDERHRARRLVSADFVEEVRAKLLKSALEQMQREKEDAMDAEADDETCAICFDNYQDPVVTKCQHIYCKECVVKVFERPTENPRFGADARPCPSCRQPIKREHLFLRKAFEPTDEELEDAIGEASGEEEEEEEEEEEDGDADMPSMDDILLGMSPKKSDKKRKGKNVERVARKLFEDSDDSMDDFIVEDGEDEETKDARLAARIRHRKKRAIIIDSDDEMNGVSDAESSGGEDKKVKFKRAVKKKKKALKEKMPQMDKFLPSTKHMMDLLKSWAKSFPADKTMVVSQWTSCLELCAHYLKENNIDFVRYQGNMSKVDRDAAILNFQKVRGGPPVMLMSLKAGGVGLNLTRANRVISLDLGWSEAVEFQAFDRVHRLGQEKDVLVNRLIIASTIEDRILDIQVRKKNLADGSLGEGTAQKIGRLSVRELAYLFGVRDNIDEEV